MTRASIFLIVLALAFWLLLLKDSDYGDFTNDADAHREYIEYIISHYALPSSRACWECFQPPAYYLLAAFPYVGAQLAGWKDPMAAVRCLSLAFYLAFIYFGWRLLRENTRSRLAYLIGFELFLFWPLGSRMATTANNDVPLAMAQAASFCYLMRWWKEASPRALGRSLAWGAAAVCFKSSGLVALAAIGITVLCRKLNAHFPWRTFYSRKIIIGLIIAALAITSVFEPMVEDWRMANARAATPFLVPNVNDSYPELRIVNTLRNYISFDMTAYLGQPFFDSWQDSSGRNYFFNALFKTALFGDFLWKSPLIATLLSILELMLAVYVTACVCRALLSGPEKAEWTPWLLFIALQVTALMGFRLLYPFGCSENFRYIFSTLPITATLYAKALDWCGEQGHKHLVLLGQALGLLFVFLSVLFISFNL